MKDQIILIFLCVINLRNFCFRNQIKKKSEVKLKEDDILRLAKLILPALNLAISKTQHLFSGEPSMTLKVIPRDSSFSFNIISEIYQDMLKQLLFDGYR